MENQSADSPVRSIAENNNDIKDGVSSETNFPKEDGITNIIGQNIENSAIRNELSENKGGDKLISNAESSSNPLSVNESLNKADKSEAIMGHTLSDTDITGSVTVDSSIKSETFGEILATSVQDVSQSSIPANSMISATSSQEARVQPDIDTNSNLSAASDNIMEITFTTDEANEQSQNFTEQSPVLDSSVVAGSGVKLGQKRKTKRRGTAWTDDETDFLMEVWARNATSREEYAHNTPVYRLISKAMIEKGYDKSWEQCKTRIHTLKRAYKITQDEVNEGRMNIIYCKHFDKLRIIMGDDPVTPPNVLADSLALKRIEKETNPNYVQNSQDQSTPTHAPKRKLGANSKSAKRLKMASDKAQTSPLLFNSLQADFQPNINSYSTSGIGWAPTVNTLPTVPSTVTALLSSSQQNNVITQDGFQMPPPPPYQPPPSFSSNKPAVSKQSRPQLQEINNNITIKTESADDALKANYTTSMVNMSTFQSNIVPTNPVPITKSTKSALQQKKEELEKLKLDLEMRKLDMERNKLEMEERQRREERDHQYRMMQLLLFGLGQQNAGNGVGHVTDQDLCHVSSTTTLTRAIENGLLPGGSLRANEKGLSFSEI